MHPIKSQFKQRMKAKLSARTHMSVILLATIACGIVASKLTLYWTEIGPILRYGVAVLFSYGMFFLFMHLWLRWFFGSRDDFFDGEDVVDAINFEPSPMPDLWKGSGGKFSGGGADTNWAAADVAPVADKESASLLSKADVGDIDELGAIIALLILIAAIFGSATYIVYQAPEIMLEAAFEFFLAAGLLRRARRISAEGWAMPIFKGTWVPFLIVFLISIAFGSWVHSNCPDARSYGEMKEICLSKK